MKNFQFLFIFFMIVALGALLEYKIQKTDHDMRHTVELQSAKIDKLCKVIITLLKERI